MRQISLRNFLFALVLPCTFYAQTGNLEHFVPDPVKVQKFLPYLEARHGGPAQTSQWKQTNKVQYQGELWYYTESFSIKRDHLSTGFTLNESIIDISRFEHLRRKTSDTVIVIPGYKDGLHLLAADKLLFNPNIAK